MRYIPTDVRVYSESKLYIDTAIVPIITLQFGDRLKQTTSSTNFLTLLSSELENQLKGRLFLTPSLVFLHNASVDDKEKALKEWKDLLVKEGFSYTFFITTDNSIKSMSEDKIDTVLWLPSLPLDQMKTDDVKIIIEDQVRQLQEILFSQWEKE